MALMREGSALGVLYSATVARMVGISGSDLECLDFVATHQPVAAGALAGAIGFTTGATTGVIDRLEEAGLVRRIRPESDRRKVLVITTDVFVESVIPLFEPMRRLQSELIGRSTEKQLRTVAGFLSSSLEAARNALAELSTREVPRSGEGVNRAQSGS
jgi:DNA-binding MarR family transcriptional regulator